MISEMIQSRALMGFETLVRSAGGDPLALLERRNINARALQETRE